MLVEMQLGRIREYCKVPESWLLVREQAKVFRESSWLSPLAASGAAVLQSR